MRYWKVFGVILLLAGALSACSQGESALVEDPSTVQESETAPNEAHENATEIQREENAPSDALFTDAEAKDPVDITDDTNILRARVVEVDLDFLAVSEGDTLILDLFDDISLEVIIDRVAADPIGNMALEGHFGIDSPSRVLIEIEGDQVSSQLKAPEGLFQIAPLENDLHAIYELEPAETNTKAGPPGSDSNPHVSSQVPVKVTHVEARTLEPAPDQVELIIQGTLPDQCEYEIISYEVRSGNTVNVTVEGIHPPETCENTEQQIEYTLLLGRDEPEEARIFAPGNYEVIVNGYPSEFSIGSGE